ncbi:MAG: family 78 glycoside hydrolase catalytic domain [Clostridia bacterium]|nr:family 78 glycoside hydrolase catalytic domain [Clostridia bacterium]
MFPNHFVSAGREYCTYDRPVPAPLFQKSFTLDTIPDSAPLIIGCTGFYELYLNGENVTDGYLAPYVANSNDVVFYRRYELAEKLHSGENRLSVLLGNGFANPLSTQIWGHDRRPGRAAPAFSLDFMDGRITAADMRWKDSPIRFDDYRCGVLCDMTAGDDGWHDPVDAEEPAGEKRFVTSPPIREVRRLRAVSICPGELRDYRVRDEFTSLPRTSAAMQPAPVCGGWIYDFGENTAGVPLLHINGQRGQVIHLQFSELLLEGFVDYINVDVYPDGCCQQDVYICGGGEETFIPPFTYHGARYCYVHGITPEQATPDLLQFLVLRNDVEVRSDFACTDSISTEIFAACRRSDEANLFHIITDCPHREKNGWTGDAAISAEHYMYNLGAEDCFADWLACIRASQAKNGALPLVVPSNGAANGCVVWDSVITALPYYAWIHTGDTRIITDNADAMLKNIRRHLSLRDERGIVEQGMGDWLPVDAGASEYASPLGFCCTVTLMEMVRMADEMLTAVGRHGDAAFCADTWHTLREAVRAEYNEGGVIGVGKKNGKPTYRPCQTSQALGLYAGVFEPSEEGTALDTLLRLVREAGGSFDCGFLGLRVIFHVLTDHGHADLAYRMITKPAHPSYANMIYRGETTVWERFVKPGGRTGSHNHHFMADVSAWYLRTLMGIRVNPERDNPDRLRVAPCFIEAVEGASGWYKTPHGKLTLRWERIGDRVTLYAKAGGDVHVDYALPEGVRLVKE